jgi:molybdopterin/thiamine biosynthesis adenylyltransferase
LTKTAPTPPLFSAEERERYGRHILLKEIGGAGQQRLKRATVVLVGVGGLGAPAAMYLAAAGVGRLRLIDPDVVSLSNLQRQVLFSSGDIGAGKPEAGAARLAALNPHVTLEPIAEKLTAETAAGLLSGADCVLDGCDDFTTRFIVNAACHAAGITLVSGAVGRFDGQVATFKSGVSKHLPPEQRLPCYACLVHAAPEAAESCAEMGVIGALTGVIGAMMALEAIKEITGAGESLAGRLWLFDGLNASSRTVRLRADPACPICGI